MSFSSSSSSSGANAPTTRRRPRDMLSIIFDPEEHSQLININQVWEADGNDVLQSIILLMDDASDDFNPDQSWIPDPDYPNDYPHLMIRLIELVDAGEYDVTHKNNDGQDALHMLTSLNLHRLVHGPRRDLRAALIRALLRHGADWTEALHSYMWPQSQRHAGIELLKLVLLHSPIHHPTHELNINMLSSHGETPLHWMIQKERFDSHSIRELLTDSCIWNIDFTIRDQHGRGEVAAVRARQKAREARGTYEQRSWLEIADVIEKCGEAHQAYFRPLIRDLICVYTPLIPDVINITLDYMYDKAS